MARSARNIGGEITQKTALRPQTSTGAASFGLAGVAINRSQFQSALFHVALGAVAGSPSAVAVRAKLQECDTQGGTYTDVAVGPANPVVAIADATAANQDRYLEVDLSPCKEWVRLAFEVVFTGGSSPNVLLAADAALGGGPVIPTVHG